MIPDNPPPGPSLSDHEGRRARPTVPPPDAGVGLEARALSSEERRTLESLPGIMAKEKFLKGRGRHIASACSGPAPPTPRLAARAIVKADGESGRVGEGEIS